MIAVAISAEESLRTLDPQAALELFESADPADANARCGRIRALWALRRADEARAALDDLPPQIRESAAGLVAAGTIALGLRDSLLLLGIYVGSVGRDDRAALEAFSAAVALDQCDPIARRGLITAHRLAERTDEARAEADRAIDELGPLPGLLIESAWCHFDLGQDEQALTVLNSAREDIEALFATAAIINRGPCPPDAEPVYERVRRLVPETSGALHGQLAQHARFTILWTAVGAERETAQATLKEHARQALLMFPGDPMTLYCLAYLSYLQNFPLFKSAEPAEVTEPEPHDDPALPESPAIAHARYLAAIRDNRLADALGHVRRARVLDPHLLGEASVEVDCLTDLGRDREAAHIGQQVLARWPGLSEMRYQLATLERGRTHPERALELLPDNASPQNVIARIGALRELGDFAAAETLASHPPRPMIGEWERQVLVELAENSIAQRHWRQAVERLDAVLKADPTSSYAREARRDAARRARFGLGRRPPSEDTDTAVADTQNLTVLLDDMLPPGSPPSLRGRLHQIHRRQRAINEANDRWRTALTLLSMLAALVLLILSGWALSTLGATGNVLLAIALPVAELVAWVLVFAWAASDGIALMVSTFIATLVGYGAVGAALLSGHGHPATLLLFPALVLGFVATGTWIIVIGILIADQVAVIRTRHQRRDDRFGYLVHDMLDLLVLLEYEPALIRPEVQRECLALLERIARGQEHVLMAAVATSGRVEGPTGHAFRQHVAGVVAATRDLERDVLSPGPRTWEGLRARLVEDLAATCHGYWNLLPYRVPDPPGKVLRIRLLSALRSLLVLVTLPVLLYLASRTHLLPAAVPQSVLLIGYLGWPGLVIMYWLDPDLLTKISLLKSGGDAVSSFKQDKSSM